MTLVFIEHREKSRARKPRALYRCECGKEFVAQVGNVKSGNTKTCGCQRGTHRMTGTSLHKAWENMRQRAENRAGIYPTYIDVRVDERWSTFQGFLDNPPTTGRPFEPGLALSRYGDTGDYSPENARWLTRAENRAEQRKPEPKTHCPQGHPYDEENTYYVGTKYHCRACHYAANLRYRARQRDRSASPS